MDNMKEDIKSILNIPCIEAEDIVHDGCFAVSPFLSGGLYGDGNVVDIVDYYQVDIFYKQAEKTIKAAKHILKELTKKKYICEMPEYVYEKEGKTWRAVMKISSFGG